MGFLSISNHKWLLLLAAPLLIYFRYNHIRDAPWLLLLPVPPLILWIYYTTVQRRRNRGAGLAPHMKPLLGQCRLPRRWQSWDPWLALDISYEAYQQLKERRLLESGYKRFQRLGNTTYVLFKMNTIMVSTTEPENIKTILATEFNSWVLGNDRFNALEPLLGEGIFVEDGEPWKWSRELLRPCFTRGRVSAVENFESHIQRFLDNVRGVQSRESIDLQPLFFQLSMDVASEFLFGERTGMLDISAGGKIEGASSEKIRKNQEFAQAFTYCMSAIEGSHEDSRGFIDLFLPNGRAKRLHKVVHAYVDEIIERGIATRSTYKPDKSNYILLQELLLQNVDPVKIRAELLNVLLAGRDSTASLLSNSWFVMSSRPDIWTRLQQEVATLDGELPTYEQIKEMKYVNAILKESLRLYPIVPGNRREAIEDTILPVGGGEDQKSPIFIPKGGMMHWDLYSMHRRKDLFGHDAEEFKPERWLDEGDRKGLRTTWEYLPFNGGPRICIGQQFALMEAAYVTVRLAQEFSGIESRDSEPWREKIGLTVTGFGGCKVALTPRA